MRELVLPNQKRASSNFCLFNISWHAYSVGKRDFCCKEMVSETRHPQEDSDGSKCKHSVEGQYRSGSVKEFVVKSLLFDNHLASAVAGSGLTESNNSELPLLSRRKI